MFVLKHSAHMGSSFKKARVHLTSNLETLYQLYTRWINWHVHNRQTQRMYVVHWVPVLCSETCLIKTISLLYQII